MIKNTRMLPSELDRVYIKNDINQDFYHYIDADMIDAVNTALAVNRPLLIWGEPGMGKSQLAKAVATELGRVYVPFVATARTEARDLLWRFDAVARLAQAQLGKDANADGKDLMALERYMQPGPLWFGFDWDNAIEIADQSDAPKPPNSDNHKAEQGAVILIDEIDKADADVPNGLLEALGNGTFTPQGFNKVECKNTKPLVMVTTNQERSLPDAFVRRCLSLKLSFPDDEKQQINFLTQRAMLNREIAFDQLDEEHFKRAAKQLTQDRATAKSHGLYPLPGQAEYFDLLRGLQRLSGKNGYTVDRLLDRLSDFILRKHPDFPMNTGGDE